MINMATVECSFLVKTSVVWPFRSSAFPDIDGSQHPAAGPAGFAGRNWRQEFVSVSGINEEEVGGGEKWLAMNWRWQRCHSGGLIVMRKQGNQGPDSGEEARKPAKDIFKHI